MIYFTIWFTKFLLAASIAFVSAVVLENFMHYKLLSWLFVFCFSFYLVFSIFNKLKTSIFFIIFLMISVLFFIFFYNVDTQINQIL